MKINWMKTIETSTLIVEGQKIAQVYNEGDYHDDHDQLYCFIDYGLCPILSDELENNAYIQGRERIENLLEAGVKKGMECLQTGRCNWWVYKQAIKSLEKHNKFLTEKDISTALQSHIEDNINTKDDLFTPI